MRYALFALLLFAAPAQAEENLTSGLSQDVVAITSNYTGTDITVFGAVEGAQGAAGDIVVVVRGPEAAMTVRRKDRIAGIWINRARARLRLPGYYFIAANRPLQEIAAADTLGRYELGLSHLHAETLASDGDPAPYVAALVRAQSRGGLYAEKDSGVEMLSSTLFRVRVPVPAAVPRGSYSVEAYLFRDGNVVSVQSTPLFVDQTGFERRLYDFAHARPLLYGLGTVLMAILLGWGSTFFFRKQA
jgi:uncharacterized protein (TIGR02186 family)